MHLYDCRLDTFIPDATSGEIADILHARFVHRMEQEPSQSEVKSWRNSLGAFAEAVSDRGMDDAWIVLEYQLPLASCRVDCMLLGTDARGRNNCALVELKQWDRCQVSRVPEVVEVGTVEMLHPCAQVRNYRQYLDDAHSAFEAEQIRSRSCAFLHNLNHSRGSAAYDARYAALLDDSPLFCAESVDALASFVSEPTNGGAPAELVSSVLSGQYRPSRKLLDYVASSIDGHEPWKLLDEQRLVFNRIMADIEHARQTGEKHVIVVKGGPGTGKSVIALQVVGVAARSGYAVVHATGSKAFTTNLRGIVGRAAPFRYFNQFARTTPDSLDLIVADEAHRLRETSASRWARGSGRPQVGEVIDAAKVSVFLLDGQQNVRPNEVGSVALILEYAGRHGISSKLYDLETQFRCAGSESYIRWVDHVLGLSANRSLAWKTHDEYDVRLFADPQEMQTELSRRVAEGYTARMVAGFTWPWSDPNEDGSLLPDVRIGGWAHPWNRKPREMWRKRKGSAENPSTHPYKIWATEPKGFGEVGCIYSAQGFEFDYVGVIFCDDLRWDPVTGAWAAHLERNKDAAFKRGMTRDSALALARLKHIYRVLSTRAMRGTYFHFLDDHTARYFERMGAEP